MEQRALRKSKAVGRTGRRRVRRGKAGRAGGMLRGLRDRVADRRGRPAGLQAVGRRVRADRQAGQGEPPEFYCSAWSNIRSARNAIKSGFIPAWVEMTVKPARLVDEMNQTGTEKTALA